MEQNRTLLNPMAHRGETRGAGMRAHQTEGHPTSYLLQCGPANANAPRVSRIRVHQRRTIKWLVSHVQPLPCSLGGSCWFSPHVRHAASEELARRSTGTRERPSEYALCSLLRPSDAEGKRQDMEGGRWSLSEGGSFATGSRWRPRLLISRKVGDTVGTTRTWQYGMHDTCRQLRKSQPLNLCQDVCEGGSVTLEP